MEYFIGSTYDYDISESDIINFSRPMDGFYNLTVVDVYDQASEIGKEFEKIIDVFGVSAITDLMPKVIQILEQLECLASKNEKDNCEVDDLQQEIQKLELEKADRAQLRLKYEQELVHIEEAWKGETGDLMVMVDALKEENRCLKMAVTDSQASDSGAVRDEEDTLLSKLKDTISAQSDQLKLLQQDLTQKNFELETAQGQIERMKKSNSDLRRRNNACVKQAHIMQQEKAELQAQLQDHEHQMEEVKVLLRRQESIEKMKTVEMSMEGVELPTSNILTDSMTTSVAESDAESLIERLISDASDRDKPRFTMNELCDVFMERNELKTKLGEVEDVLEQIKSQSGDDVVAEGPINKEPDEKLYPERYTKKNSSIKKNIPVCVQFKVTFNQQKAIFVYDISDDDPSIMSSMTFQFGPLILSNIPYNNLQSTLSCITVCIQVFLLLSLYLACLATAMGIAF